MQKILFLDWDGPVSNSRTWKMPRFVDPVAIRLLNDATKAGWRTVLSSTIRKNFGTVEEATKFMNEAGFYPQWAEVWRTDPGFTKRRHLEIEAHLMRTEYDKDAIFLVVDDERMPIDILEHNRMSQIYVRSDNGIDYLNISEAYRYFEMTDAQLDAEFGNGNHV